MSHPHSGSTAKLTIAFREATQKRIFPLTTVRCSDPAVFQTQAARDLGCLLDVDDSVVAWSCLPREFDTAEGTWIPDFIVDYDDGKSTFLDATSGPELPWVTEAIACQQESHSFVTSDATHEPRGFTEGPRFLTFCGVSRSTTYRRRSRNEPSSSMTSCIGSSKKSKSAYSGESSGWTISGKFASIVFACMCVESRISFCLAVPPS